VCRLPLVDYKYARNHQSGMPGCPLTTQVWVTLRGVMANGLGLATAAVSANTVFIAESILLVLIVLTFGFGWLVLHSVQRKQTKTWLVWRGFGRFVLAATVAAWWVTWDLGGRSEIPATFLRIFPGAWGRSYAEAFLFWLPPVVSLGVFLVVCYVVDRWVLKQRWSFVACCGGRGGDR
jgi:hypothetical protein